LNFPAWLLLVLPQSIMGAAGAKSLVVNFEGDDVNTAGFFIKVCAYLLSECSAQPQIFLLAANMLVCAE